MEQFLRTRPAFHFFAGALTRLASAVLVLCWCVHGVTATRLEAQQRGLATDTTEKVDAILLLDTSGSMLVNDPQRLRDEGARLFVQFLKPGDSLAIIDFAETAKVVRPLTPYDASQAEQVGALISGLKTEGQYTDLLAAIEKATEVIEAHGRADAKPVVVLLSDGKMDPNPAVGLAAARTQILLEQTLPALRTQSRRVYTLAFSPDADRELLQQIAAATDAIQWYTVSPNEVHQSFAELFLAVKRPQVIPLGAKGFTVDDKVSEATFYINRATENEVQVQHPNGQLFTSSNHPSNIKWFSSQRFEVITIEKPQVGTWRVSGVTKEEGFATILTNLRLITDWGGVIEAKKSELLQARLYEADKPIALPEMTGLIRYAYQITPTDRVAEPIVRDLLVDDGTKGDTIANDGIFAHNVLIEVPGEYELRIIAKGPTFERQLQIPFRVKPPMITVKPFKGVPAVSGAGAKQKEHEESQSSHDEKHGSPGAASSAPRAVRTDEELLDKEGVIAGDQYTVFLVEINEEAVQLKNATIEVVATDDQRRIVKLPVTPAGSEAGVYEVSAGLLPSDGRFEIRATVSGEGRGRAAVRESSRSFVFTRTSIGEVPNVILVPKQEAPPEEEGFPFLALVIMMVIIAASGASVIFLAKRDRGDTTVDTGTAPVSEALLAKVVALEARAKIEEVDVNAPEFEGDTAPVA
jgi:uncharacterized protein YegL